MLSSRNRKLWAVLLICATGTVFQAMPSGCAQYHAASLLSAFDFCSVFNCEGGTFFNFCEPVRVFVDCPLPPTQ